MSGIGHMAGETRQLVPIGDVRPYPDNPRVITPEAVAAVRTSIEQYGYKQPIVVDTDNVVIVGHTRLQALTALGYTHVDVRVVDLPPEKAREYRLADNRLAELGQWDPSELIAELREWETDLLTAYFPNIDLELGQLAAAQEADELEGEMAAATAAVTTPTKSRPVLTTEVTCPSCSGHFMVETSSLPGLSNADVAELRHGQEH